MVAFPSKIGFASGRRAQDLDFVRILTRPGGQNPGILSGFASGIWVYFHRSCTIVLGTSRPWRRRAISGQHLESWRETRKLEDHDRYSASIQRALSDLKTMLLQLKNTPRKYLGSSSVCWVCSRDSSSPLVTSSLSTNFFFGSISCASLRAVNDTLHANSR